MERKWETRAYREGDEEKIFRLWQVVWPEEKHDWGEWLRRWRWMYRDNPAGAGKIWLAEHDDRVIGHTAVIPVVMKIADKVVTGFQSVDTMTHPSYRRQGIYGILAKRVFAEAEKEGIHVGYRFTNPVSHLIAVKKQNWFDVVSPQIMVRAINWADVFKARISNTFLSQLCTMGGNLANKVFCRTRRTPTVQGLTITQNSSFDDRIDDFWTKVCSQHEIMVVRNKDYLNWRYPTSDIPYSIYIAEKGGEIQGYIVLACRQQEHAKTGVIFDILAESKEIAQCLVSKAVEHCQQEGVDHVYCRMIASKTYLNSFKRNGFISRPFGKGGYFSANTTSPHISKEFLRNPKNWFIQIGDRDVV